MVEYYIIKPSLKTFGGIKVEKDTKFECDNDDKTVHQKLENLILTTHIEKEIDNLGIKSTENSTMTSEIPEGTILLWSEETGYIVPNYQMVRPEEALNLMQEVVKITGDIENSNKEE